MRAKLHGSGIFGEGSDDAAPTGLEFSFWVGFYRDAAPMALKWI